MNAPHDRESGDEIDAGLNAGTDDFVRRLLADARPDSAVPEQVAARLDDTLAELVAQRSASEREEERAAPTELPDDLSAVRARRRRRLLVGLGMAAAFVVAAGIALPAWIGSDSPQSIMATSDRDASEQLAAGPLTLQATSAEKAVQDYVAGLDEPVETPAPGPLRSPMGGALSELKNSTEDSADRGTFAAAEAPPTCDEPGEGEVHPATYDGQPALLVLTGVDGDRVLARVVLCDDADRSDNNDTDSESRGVHRARTSEVPVQFVVPQP